MRRRKKKSDSVTPKERTRMFEGVGPLLDTYCSVCLPIGREWQRQSPDGPVCKFGHGGADGITDAEFQARLAKEREAKTREEARDLTFEVRDGDRLTVMYHGAKLQIAPYNSVELDGGIYSRTLEEGDDPEAEWNRIYAYLERKALERARKKLRIMSAELHRARKNVETGTAYDG